MRHTFVKIILAALFITSCTSKPVPESVDIRLPASTPDLNAITPDIPEVDARLLNQMTEVDLKRFIAAKVRYDIILGGHSQKIVASFDEKLSEGLAAASVEDADRAKTELKEIDCQVMELNSLSHDMEEGLRIMYKSVLERNDPALTDWFLERLAVAPGYDTVPQIMARLGYVRMLKEYHKSICNDTSCATAKWNKKRLRFPFDPFNDRESYDYKKANNKSIALFSANPMSKQGSCISRYPSSEDSVGKNFFGGNLPQGAYSVTYDDGPHKTHTREIAQIWLDSKMAKPTFFWLGQEAKKYPDIVKDVSKKGFEIACHSYSHPDLGNIASAKSYDDLQQANVKMFFPDGVQPKESFQVWRDRTLSQQFYGAINVIEKTLQAAPVSPQTKLTKFRFPYGSGYKNPVLLEMVRKQGMVHFHWMIDSLDYHDKNPLSILDRVKSQMKLQKHGIILFHDIHPQSVEASKLLIKYFQETKGLSAASLEKAL